MITIRLELYADLSALLLQQQPATISFAARAFCAAAPKVWISYGVHTCSADTFLTFKNRLKLDCLNLSDCFGAIAALQFRLQIDI